MIVKLLTLFWVFFKIGLFTFGGGYAMIPMITEEMIGHGWMVEQQISDFIAIGEMTPGPFAINMATLIGSMHAGPLGAVAATLGVVVPPVIIILLIARLFKSISTNKYVQAALKGLKPVIVGLIFSTGLLLILKNIFNSFFVFQEGLNIPSICIMIILATFSFLYKKVTKKAMHPIALIGLAAMFGIIVFI